MAADLRRDLLIRQQDADPAITGVQTIEEEKISSREGLWPGVRKGPNVEGRGDETASASVEPWVDANGYLAACLLALGPGRVPLLGYKPDLGDRVVPYDTLELAFIEARVCGGNYVLSPEPRFRAGLRAGKADAVAAWKRLQNTAAWLGENDALLGRPAIPSATVLVEATETSFELVNLLFRRNASPQVRALADVPAPSPQRPVIVAAGLASVPAEIAARILAHAHAGAVVMTDDAGPKAWWRTVGARPVKSQEDRDFYRRGKGMIVAYKAPVADPSEFALDVIDQVTHPRRAVRMWNAGAVIGVATEGRRPGEAILHAINYGSPIDDDVQTRVFGNYGKATFLAPGENPVSLQVFKRGLTTEVMIPRITRLATVIFG
ncbi:MAG: hypothetical protein SFV51_16480 [Bryobacteraceae bacterium]|nr:hypothetical protein [Bryobacteraceae bacterium]